MPHAPSAADLLLEIGTEELPAAYLPGLIEQLRQAADVLLRAQHLSFAAVQTFGAPRRLVLIVRGLSATQEKPAEAIRGPSKRAAYDQDGASTPALLGFLRSRGGTLAQVKIIASDKGEYISLLKPPVITPTAKLLPALLPQLIGSLRAPKTMRWDESGVRFARPIRWLLTRYSTTAIRCRYGRLTSGVVTWVGQPLRPNACAVASIDAYLSRLKQAGVLLDHTARRTWIERAVTRAAATSRGRIASEMISHGLLDEVTHLVERPVVLTAAFDPAYLVLPREVLLASMAKHQRVFAVEAKGRLLPHCVAILEGRPGRPALVRTVIERILNARLADSLLFWTDDLKRPLQDADLSGVTFHEQLGSMQAKTERLAALAPTLAEAWALSDPDRAYLARACRLSKADLVSTMVKEFPTLQGVVGKYYAQYAHEPQEVATAIEEHYLPLSERSPTTLIGRALALLDKYDTLASYFSVGIEPTGDQDPFGLRRAAQGLVDITWAARRPLPWARLFAAWAPLAPFARRGTEANTRLRRYVLERLYTFPWPAPAPSPDYLEAVLAGPCEDLLDVMHRIQHLWTLRQDPVLLKAAKVIERTRNILKGAASSTSPVDPTRFVDPLEQALWARYGQVQPRLAQLLDAHAYGEATTAFGEAFFQPLHDFFERVLVNAPEESLKQNRIALMRAIHSLYTDRVADLSKLTVLQPHNKEHA